MVTRRAFIGTLAGGLLAAPLAAGAQQTGKVPRIGYLSSGSATTTRLVEGFRQGLREFGWVEGQNVVIDYRFAEGRFGLIASLARPGGNVTGLSFSVGLDSIGKALELLKEVVPKVRRVAILSNPANLSHALAIKNLKVAARSLGVQLQLLEARGPNEFDGAFVAMAKGRAEALLVVPDSMFVLQRTRLADLAAKNRLPSMHGVREHVEAGGLMSYGPSAVAVWRRAAFFVDKILKGAKPADLPVEQPTQFEFVINLKTAKALGLTIPQSLLQRADQVIK